MTEQPVDNESPAYLKAYAQAKAATEMGLSDLEDIMGLIQGANDEELRAATIKAATELITVGKGILRTSASFYAWFNSTVTAPMQIADGHIEAQKAMLKRLTKLSENATAEELPLLLAAYTYLPQPYSQSFDPNFPTFAWTDQDEREESASGDEA